MSIKLPYNHLHGSLNKHTYQSGWIRVKKIFIAFKLNILKATKIHNEGEGLGNGVLTPSLTISQLDQRKPPSH